MNNSPTSPPTVIVDKPTMDKFLLLRIRIIVHPIDEVSLIYNINSTCVSVYRFVYIMFSTYVNILCVSGILLYNRQEYRDKKRQVAIRLQGLFRIYNNTINNR